MFENLSDRFEKAFQRIKGEATITEANIAETTKEIRRALVEADVNYSVAKRFANRNYFWSRLTLLFEGVN